MTDEHMRLIGVASGYAHALVMLKTKIGQMRYHPIPPRYTRQQATRDAQIAPLAELYGRLENDLRRLQAVISTKKGPP